MRPPDRNPLFPFFLPLIDSHACRYSGGLPKLALGQAGADVHGHALCEREGDLPEVHAQCGLDRRLLGIAALYRDRRQEAHTVRPEAVLHACE